MSPTTPRSAGLSPFGPRSFVLLVAYTAPLPRIDALLDEHRTWLDRNFDDGTFLVSGPQVPRVGGAIIATAASRQHVEEAVSADPFVREGLATYQVVEFTPTRGPYAAATHAPVLAPERIPSPARGSRSVIEPCPSGVCETSSSSAAGDGAAHWA